MSKMVLALLIVGFSLFTIQIFPVTVAASNHIRFVPSDTDVNSVGGCDGAAANSPVCTDLRSDTNPLFGPDGLLTRVANIFALVTGVISLFMITIGGLRYINSSGDSSKTASAKSTILYAVIGIVVASMAGLIANFILSRL